MHQNTKNIYFLFYLCWTNINIIKGNRKKVYKLRSMQYFPTDLFDSRETGYNLLATSKNIINIKRNKIG